MKSICLLLCFSIPALLSAQPQDSATQLRKADSLFDAGNWKASATAYEQGLQNNATNARAWYRLGEAYQLQGLYNAAIGAYKKSIELPAGPIPPIFIKTGLAKAYSQNKDSASTFKLLAEMVTAGYRNFPDLNSANEYKWLRSSKSFETIIIKAKENAYPCMNDPHNREFDFWVGRWNVYQTGTNFQVGTSKIENVSGGCLILENWTATGNPDEGKSMNFLNTKTSKWEQHYVGIAGGSQYYYNGGYRDGAMRYDADGVDKAGNKLLFHLTYFNQGPDQVRQLLEQSSDGGKTWITLYDFTYKRIK